MYAFQYSSIPRRNGRLIPVDESVYGEEGGPDDGHIADEDPEGRLGTVPAGGHVGVAVEASCLAEHLQFWGTHLI